MQLPTAKVHVRVLSTSLSTAETLSCIILLVYDMTPLGTFMQLWSKSADMLKPPPETLLAFFWRGHRGKAGFLQLENVGACE